VEGFTGAGCACRCQSWVRMGKGKGGRTCDEDYGMLAGVMGGHVWLEGRVC